MIFVFAALSSEAENGAKVWPIPLIYLTEKVLLGVALACFLIPILLKRPPVWLKILIVFVGGVSAGIGSIMPFELAPIFFGSRGEIMMATIGLNLVYPFAIALFVFLYMKLTGLSAKDLP